MRGDFDPLTILHTAALLRREKIQIVLTNMDKELRFAGLAAKLLGGCAVIPRRGIDYPLKNRLHYRLSYQHLAQAVIANSQATKRALLRHAAWLDPDKIHVIYNGIDPAPFTGSADKNLRRSWGIPETEPVIGFVGQLDERKGIKELLPAFARVVKEIPQAHLVLCGSGALETQIRTFSRENRLSERLHLLGFCRDMVDVMKSIDCLVLPSYWEGFGIVLIEAMAAAKPCVTTNISSMPEIVVDGETGRVVPVADVDALTNALIEILRDPVLSRKYGCRGQLRVAEKFTIARMIDQLEALFVQTGNTLQQEG
ncbi:glycosyltransferase, partial [candidate division KSB1 bacterium]|nr:glycosyltransferase [candidate division KSB1 bacterium]